MFETPLTVVGRVITDITQHTMPNGDKMCSFRMVARERRYDREAQEWRDGDSLFVQVKCWRKATGRLYLRQYEVNGEPRSMVELDAQAIGPNLAQCTVLLDRPYQTRPAAEEEPVTVGALAA
jgi:single-strand DNA-binding protein